MVGGGPRGEPLGLIGHGEGGVLEPLVAHDPASGVAFVVTLAGPAVPGVDIIRQQNLDGLATQGVDAAKAAPLAKALDSYFGLLALPTLPSDADIEAKARALVEATQALAKETGTPLPQSMIDGFLAQMKAYPKSPRLLAWVRSNPVPDLIALTVPFIAFYGDKDTQVPAAIHAKALQDAFTAAKKGAAPVVVIAGANHLFQQATTGQVPEYDELEETMVPSTLAQIVEWIRKTTAKP